MKSKIVTVHQPEFLPTIGLIKKISLADHFFIYDDVEAELKNNFQCRNRILQVNGPIFVKVPLVKAPHEAHIRNIKINTDLVKGVMDKFRKQLEFYRKAPFYEETMDFLEDAFFGCANSTDSLCYLNSQFILKILDYLEIYTMCSYSSPWGAEGHSTDHLVNLCKLSDATVYISGMGGKNYLETEKFGNIKVTFFDSKNPPYPQYGNKGEFIPYLSIIDTFMNLGREGTKRYLQEWDPVME